MKKIDTSLLTTLLNVDSEKAKTYLANLGYEIRDEVFKATSNEERIEGMKILEEFVYKVPTQTIEIVRNIMSQELPTQDVKSPFGIHAGKTHSDVMERAIGLLKEIRYIHPDGVLPILAEIIRSDKPEKGKALEALKDFAEYNYNVLTKSKLGYGPQRYALDYILKWTLEERALNFDFVEIVIRELLNSSLSGTTNTAVDTITFHSGALVPNDFLKKLRRETIDIATDLYNRVDEKRQLRLVKALEEAIRGPINVAYGPELEETLNGDAAYLLDIYRNMLFDGDKLVGSIAVAEEIQKRLYWFHRSEKLNTPAAAKLREDIISDEFFSLFRLFAGDEVVLRQEEDEMQEEQKRSQVLEEKLKEVDSSNLTQWNTDFNRIASQLGPIEEWQFRNLKMFLNRLATEKPELAFSLGNDALTNDKPLENFLTHILDGLRAARRFDLWDKLMEAALKKQQVRLVAAVVYSLNVYNDAANLEEEIRDKDLEVLTALVNRTGLFSFLEEAEWNYPIEHSTINSLMRNFKRAPKLIENLMIKTLQRYPEKADAYVREISFAQYKKWIDYDLLSKEGMQAYQDWLVSVLDLSWEEQNLLQAIGEKNIDFVFEVFLRRINEEQARKAKDTRIIGGVRYDAVPYHLNPELTAQLSVSSAFQSHMEKWIEGMTPKWSVYNWCVAEFMHQMGKGYEDILFSLIERGDKVSIERAVSLIEKFDGAHINAAVEIVRRTDNKSIIKHVGGMLYSTGVVTGENGIARAYEAKAKDFEKYLNDPDKKVQDFAKKMIEGLKASAESDRKRSAEEKQIRKIEFEG